MASIRHGGPLAMRTPIPILLQLAGLLLCALPPTLPAATATPTARVEPDSVPSAAPAATRSQRRVFVCAESGIPVYSDRPCGSSTSVHEIDFATPGGGQAASLAPPAPVASTRPRPETAPPPRGRPDAGETRCTALRTRLEGIDRQMRAGYSAREAARLWQRWREARAELRRHRC
jgi:hypothetical protein